MEITVAQPAWLEELAELVAVQQADPHRHIGYLGDDATSIAADLRRLEPAGLDGVVIARVAQRPVGVLGAEYDREPPRVWWHGPFVRRVADPAGVADRLYTAARDRLPAHVREEELAPDDRNELVADFARRHGFVAEEASAVLTRPLEPGQAAALTQHPEVSIAPLGRGHRREVAELHEATFPGTHTVSDRLDLGAKRRVLVATVAGHDTVCGYVAVEVQADRAGYIDYLAVSEQHRGRGVGGVLVSAACASLAEAGCGSAALTVRESNHAARALYWRLGFREVRLLRPWRRGFQLRPPVTAGGPETPAEPAGR